MGCRQGAARTHPRNGAVTEPQRRRQPIFNATLRAGTLWRFSGVPRLAEIAADIGAALAPWKIAKLSPANGKLFQRQDTSSNQFAPENVRRTGRRRGSALCCSPGLLPGRFGLGFEMFESLRESAKNFRRCLE
jgi:hypothetical protein